MTRAVRLRSVPRYGEPIVARPACPARGDEAGQDEFRAVLKALQGDIAMRLEEGRW